MVYEATCIMQQDMSIVGSRDPGITLKDWASPSILPFLFSSIYHSLVLAAVWPVLFPSRLWDVGRSTQDDEWTPECGGN